MSALDLALTRAESLGPELVERLKQLVRIPSCSFAGFDPAEVDRSAAATCELLAWAGYPAVRIVRLPGVLPYVVASDRRAGADAPTLLLYAHHDVQPPLRREVWRSDPFEPVEREGRLYGRGAADDKAGIAIHALAARAWNDTAGRPPVNLVVVIEGEEEIGSGHFSEFLSAHREELAADVLVIADLINVDTGLPSLTTSLRGNVVVEIELRALRAPLHSGIWGGGAPDVALGLARLLATLGDDAGRITIPGLQARVREPTADELASFARVPYTPTLFAAQAGLLKARPPADGASLHRRLWREPSLAINAIQCGVRGQTGNVLMDSAWARVGIRLVPDMDPGETTATLVAHLHHHAPAWAELTVTTRGDGSAAWSTPTDHPAFAAARRALALGFGVEPVLIGCGASIPFVADATAALGGIPALLTGVEDPFCAAHSENESVHLGDLHKALRSEVALFAYLGEET